MQDCLIEILRALDDYRGEGQILHYIKRIALRSAVAARNRGRMREQRLRVFAAEPSVREAKQSSVETLGLQLVRDVIDALPQPQAEALLMCALLGLSIEELAQKTHVSVNTAKSRLRVAKENLRLRLGRESRRGAS